jgi:hypothetical protein
MTTRTTFHLSISRWNLTRARVRAWLLQRDPYTLVAPLSLALLCLIVALAIVWQLRPPRGGATEQPTSLPAIMIIATARAEHLPTPFPTVAPRLVVAFAAPNGIAFPDPIAQPDPSTWIGRWGDGWIEVAWSPNPIWIRAADIGAQLADVRPVPQITIAPVAAPAPAQQYQIDSDLPAAPPPTLTAAEREQALDREFGTITDADRAAALDAHNVQQLAWCADKQSQYCDMVRGAVAR